MCLQFVCIMYRVVKYCCAVRQGVKENLQNSELNISEGTYTTVVSNEVSFLYNCG